MWSCDPESYDGLACATGMASHARQFRADDQGKEISWPSTLGVGREADKPTQ